MDDDEFSDELAHQEFLEELGRLQEQIFLAWLDRPANVLVQEHNDIMRYGNEPIFTSMLFDRILNESAQSNDTSKIAD